MSICSDIYATVIGLIPKRITRVNPDAVKDRWVNYVYTMDLTPDPADDTTANPYGAWSVWDIPANIAAQIDDERGDDLIIVAIANRVYQLDWTRFRDEYNWGAYSAIHRLLRIGPIPMQPNDLDQGRGYDPRVLKRFAAFLFSLRHAPTDRNTKYRIAVEPWNDETKRRSGERVTQQHNKAKVAVRGYAFTVELYHAANEQFSLANWEAVWEPLGVRVKENVSSGS